MQYPTPVHSETAANLGVSGPDMDLFLGQVALVRYVRGTQVDAHILWDVEVRATLVVVHVLDWRRSCRTQKEK